ncbi:MAG TPA: hypothetical protein VJU13_06020 [Candidatus Nitrosocosmicus sp.]|nr:hypothetical protein [Candidatus Nitrosocosmicus sp.]
MNSYENNDNVFGKDNDKNDIDNRLPIKGKSALDALHEDIVKEKEKTLSLKISDMYGVDYDEANEIHINYHNLRLKKMIQKSEILSSMSAFIDSNLDLKTLSTQVALGEITENTCIDILIGVMKNQKETRVKDRYINFYG